MGKINFTKEHYAQLKELATEMLFSNTSIQTQMGQSLGVSELLHTTTINSLNTIRTNIAKKIETKESADEWGQTDREQRELESLKTQKEFVNLIIGWKRKMVELNEIARLREQLKEQLATLKESEKTPKERIAELEEQLKGLSEF